MRSRYFILLILFLKAVEVFSWGSHYLITYYSLNSKELDFLNKEVPTEDIEDFIKKEKQGIHKVLKEYYEWLNSYHPHRMNPEYLKNPFDVANPNLKSFLKALRLNPETKFYLVNRVLPSKKPTYNVVPTEKVYPFYKDQGFFYLFEDVSDKKVSLRSVLITFADEPDWIMDHHLWGFQEYGYGKQPYGEPEGESSKAPFHMQFLHEPWIAKKFASFLLEGMVIDRIVLFTKLAKFAKETGHEYWAYRFLSWAIHYYQDLAQPYHAKAVPEADFWYYVRYIVSLDKKTFQQRTTQLLKNKHFIYEDFVSVYLEKSFIPSEELANRLVSYLSNGPLLFKKMETALKLPTKDYYQIVWDLTEYSSEHGYTLDKNIQKIFGKHYTQDYNVDVERDPNYKISELIQSVDDEKKNLLLEETGKDFRNTAQITRFAVLDLAQSKP
ncbi:MAG: hypothetical protein ACK4UJ_10170 [Leptonema sp. (in: bacteria)]